MVTDLGGVVLPKQALQQRVQLCSVYVAGFEVGGGHILVLSGAQSLWDGK